MIRRDRGALRRGRGVAGDSAEFHRVAARFQSVGTGSGARAVGNGSTLTVPNDTRTLGVISGDGESTSGDSGAGTSAGVGLSVGASVDGGASSCTGARSRIGRGTSAGASFRMGRSVVGASVRAGTSATASRNRECHEDNG